jgi:hypothetical protein
MEYHGLHVMMPATYNNVNKLTTTTETPVESNEAECGCAKNAMLTLKRISMALISVIRR